MYRIAHGGMCFGAGRRADLLDSSTVLAAGRGHKSGAKSCFESVTRNVIAGYTWRGAYGESERRGRFTRRSAGHRDRHTVVGAGRRSVA
jgi:hypothetical protein